MVAAREFGVINRLAIATRSAVTAFIRSIGGVSGVDVAGGSGRWPANAMIWSPVNQTQAAAKIARRRVAYLVENSPLAASIVQTFVTAAVADGPSVRSNVVDEGEREDIEARFNTFAAQCDIEGIVDLGGYLDRIVRGFLIDGESFTHFAVDDDELRLRYLAADQVDPALTRVGNMSGIIAPRIVQGIETDAQGRRLAYWLLPSAPDVPWAAIGPPSPVPAMDIAHLYEPRFPGQLRGLSPLAPVAPRLLQLSQTEDAAAQKALVSALFAGYVRDIDNASGIAGDAKSDPGALSMEPGTLRILPPGCDITFTPVSDMSTIEGVLKHLARSACAGAGVPYMIAANDLAETNFSSAQVGLQMFRRRIRAFQQNHLVGQVLAPIWRRFVLLEVLSGRIRARDFERDPARYMTARFLFQGWPALDPLKQSKADALDLAAKTRSRAEIISDRGRDPADVDEEIQGDPFQGESSTAAASAAAQLEASDATP